MAKTKNENTEQQILEAAKKVFQLKGMDGARMQEIADEAGINKAMLHYYYRSKQLLFEAVFSHAFAMMAPQLNQILNDDSSIEEKIRHFTHDHLSFIMEHPYLPKFIIQELNRNPDFVTNMKTKTGFPSIEKFKIQVAAEVKQGILKPIAGEQLFINILALNIFPIIASPMIKAFIRADDEGYTQLLESRKTEVANFIINAIKA
ncbi:TetR/AcrR family transcriptional regulator [Roseivirga echinicomitans]|uniref:TetR family transcriptional regulator n=1 Tax=Roseivirga echinicomitans TaxID=296218 RepID=A0A150X232_9BACT|nr:TetR/AcrR family transcriptional regulator [Roseivirga echinicomitans]KYG72780.1 TetR family transcriptional regulator [Roseivirga echinicomitans]